MTKYRWNVMARLLGIIWAACAAALLGVLMVAATGGSAPPAALVAALVAIPAVATLLVQLRRRFSHRDRRVVATPLAGARAWPAAPDPESVAATDLEPATTADRAPAPAADRSVAPPPAPAPRESRRLLGRKSSSRKQSSSAGHDSQIGDGDLDDVRAICGALGDRKLDWLRSNGFASPWLDGQARPAIELAPRVARLIEAPLGPELRRTLLALSNAIEVFAAFYDEHTSADPLVRGEEWRFFDWDDPDSEEVREPGAGTWSGRAVRLQELANQLADAYEAFTTAVARDPGVQHVISVRA